MALISCPQCGTQISDKAEKCIHCGYILKEQPKHLCEDCGAEIPEGATVCPTCGCPVKEEPDTNPAPIPVYYRAKIPLHEKIYKKLGKKGIAIVVASVIVIVGGSIGTSKYVATQKAEAAAAEAAQISEDYRTNYGNAVVAMYSGAGTAEKCGNLIKSVWNNAIFDKYDSETSKYTNNAKDFNEALQNLFNDKSFSEDISSIKSNKNTVQELMNALKNPPDEWQNAYDDLEEAYDAYLDIVNLTTSPTGSLQTFSSNFNDADSSAAKALEKALGYTELG